jgi:two-component system sensor histidine kinase UhpB
MKIQDNGKGLAPGERRKKGSFGLMGIKERAFALEATLSIESSPENGTALTICIAMKDDEAPARTDAACRPCATSREEELPRKALALLD